MNRKHTETQKAWVANLPLFEKIDTLEKVGDSIILNLVIHPSGVLAFRYGKKVFAVKDLKNDNYRITRIKDKPAELQYEITADPLVLRELKTACPPEILDKEFYFSRIRNI